MRQNRSGNAARTLHQNINHQKAGGQLATCEKHQTDGRVKMRARHWSQYGDQHIENGTGGNCIAQKRYAIIAAGQRGRHNAGADNGADQQQGAQSFGQQLTHNHLPSAARNASRRFLIMAKTSRKCARTASSLP